MCDVLQLAVDNGATTLNIPDTVGFGVPEEFGDLIKHILTVVQGDYVVSTHCHNDLGLAVANSLAGVAAGGAHPPDRRRRRAPATGRRTTCCRAG